MSVRRFSLASIRWRRLFRYGLVGTSLSLVYVALTSLIIEIASSEALAASIIAFVLSLPIAYLSHRYVTFDRVASSSGRPARFVITMVIAFAVSSLSMVVLVDFFGAHYGYALAVTTVLVPTLNYVVLSAWVFAAKDGVEGFP